MKRWWNEWKWWFWGGFVLIVLIFILGWAGLGWDKTFLARQENVRREAFEETQSYVHGMRNELAFLYQQYQAADMENRKIIQSVVRMKFNQFDATKLTSPELKQFLADMRGFE